MTDPDRTSNLTAKDLIGGLGAPGYDKWVCQNIYSPDDNLLVVEGTDRLPRLIASNREKAFEK